MGRSRINPPLERGLVLEGSLVGRFEGRPGALGLRNKSRPRRLHPLCVLECLQKLLFAETEVVPRRNPSPLVGVGVFSLGVKLANF